MADKETSALTAASALDGTELVHVTQGGNSRKATVTQIREPKLTRIQLQANSSKSNNTFNAHSWVTGDVIQDELAAWSSGAPTRITTPSGYTRVRISVAPVWPSNSTGARWAYVTANGGAQVLSDNRSASNESGTGVISQWLTVTAGDYFEVTFAQTSGGALNLAGASALLAQATRVQFEWRP